MPQGITALDPFAIPLLNTFLLLSSGAFITYGHHALIQGDRKGAISGTLYTIVLAIIFTALQYYEYSEAAFSISDSVYGTVFYASTGLHGLNKLAPTKINLNKSNQIRKIHNITSEIKMSALNLLIHNSKSKKMVYIDHFFLNWLIGFVDAEGNFNISLRNYKDNHYNSLILTFQIGLHIDDLEVLKFIQKNLRCGKITISGNRCQFFVNDRSSLINIIIPVFNFTKLKSSKYYQYLIFEKAVHLIKNKSHLTSKGKLEIIKLYHEIKNPTIFLNPKIEINKYWLGGFVDGDATFSAGKMRPRFKFENHVKELPLFKTILEYFQYGHINITNSRKNPKNSNQMVTLEFNNIHFLKNVIVPLFSSKLNEFKLLNSKKEKDFNDWVILVDIYYYGYHTIPEGASLAKEITTKWNNFRLSSHQTLKSGAKTVFNSSDMNLISVLATSKIGHSVKDEKIKQTTLPLIPHYIDYTEKYKLLSKIPSPYTIKNGVRFYRNTLKLVSDKLKIIAIDHFNNEFVFSSISECSRILQIERYNIKKYLLNGEIYKNYKFKFHTLDPQFISFNTLS